MIYAADFSLATLLSSMSWTFNSNNFLWLGNALTLVHSTDDPTNPTDNVLVGLHDTNVRLFPLSTPPPSLALSRFPRAASKTSAL